MWDVIRWGAAILAFSARWVRWLCSSTPVNELDGIEYFEEPARAGVRARVPVVFEIGTKDGSSIFRTFASDPGHTTGDEPFDRQAPALACAAIPPIC